MSKRKPKKGLFSLIERILYKSTTFGDKQSARIFLDSPIRAGGGAKVKGGMEIPTPTSSNSHSQTQLNIKVPFSKDWECQEIGKL